MSRKPSPEDSAGASLRYVLVTPARNEERYILQTIDAIRAQTTRPIRWVIVDDGSTDRTGELTEDLARQEPWIEVVRRPRRSQRSFAGKAEAFNLGFERVRHLTFDLIGCIDGDVTFDPDFFTFLVAKFQGDAQLGVAGAAMIEEGYDPLTEGFFNEQDPFGACQLFRRACFEDVGGYKPVRGGGIDWIALRTARMHGWKTRCFLDKAFHHHRPMGATETSVLRARFDYGRKDYYLGNHPLWQLLRIGFQLRSRPYIVGSLLLLAGYLHAALLRAERPVSRELIAFHRREQMVRLNELVRRRLAFMASLTRAARGAAE